MSLASAMVIVLSTGFAVVVIVSPAVMSVQVRVRVFPSSEISTSTLELVAP